MLPVSHEIDGNRTLSSRGDDLAAIAAGQAAGLIPRQRCIALRLLKDSKAGRMRCHRRALRWVTHAHAGAADPAVTVRVLGVG
jgi:hypothetical protein